MKNIMKCKFGSHLYGTNNENSDIDYKGIILPTITECILNKIPKSINTSTGNCNSKNTSEDIDEEYYSLQYFMKLALNNEMIVLDMLHVPKDMLIETTPLWDYITSNRHLFYSKNMKGYLSYIRKQASKYGVKGSRLAALKELYSFLKVNIEKNKKLETIWDKLPQNEYCFHIDELQDNKIPMYEYCGKKVQSSVSIEYLYYNVFNMYNKYGDRAKQAERNEGIDWKAISHAIRAGLQLKEIYETGNLVYPLKNAEYIKDIKQGKYHYKNDDIPGVLESLLNDVNNLAENSNYNDDVNEQKIDQLIINIYKGEF